MRLRAILENLEFIRLPRFQEACISKRFFWEEEKRKKSPSMILPFYQKYVLQSCQQNFPFLQALHRELSWKFNDNGGLLFCTQTPTLATPRSPYIFKPPGEVCAWAMPHAMMLCLSFRQADMFLFLCKYTEMNLISSEKGILCTKKT